MLARCKAAMARINNMNVEEFMTWQKIPGRVGIEM